MTKIIYVITKSNWGGAQRYVFDMALRASRQKNCDVTVALGGNGSLAQELQAEGIRVLHVKGLARDVNPIDDFKAFFSLLSLFHKERPDIIHLNSSKIGAVGALAGRILGVRRIIFTAHGWAFNGPVGPTSKVIFKFLHWLTIIFSHKTIAVSQNLKSQFKSWPFTTEKIVVIHNGAEPAKYLSRETARQQLISSAHSPDAHSPDTLWVGTIAELHRVKSLDTALHAISELVKEKINIRYVIMGEGEERTHLERLIEKLGLSENVFLLGHVDTAAQYLKAFDVFMLVSISEALAYVIIEAGMAGIPIVATNVGGIPELIENMKSGLLVEPRKPSEIVHALQFLFENKKIAAMMAHTLQTKMMSNFSVSAMFEKTFMLY